MVDKDQLLIKILIENINKEIWEFIQNKGLEEEVKKNTLFLEALSLIAEEPLIQEFIKVFNDINKDNFINALFRTSCTLGNNTVIDLFLEEATKDTNSFNQMHSSILEVTNQEMLEKLIKDHPLLLTRRNQKGVRLLESILVKKEISIHHTNTDTDKNNLLHLYALSATPYMIPELLTLGVNQNTEVRYTDKENKEGKKPIDLFLEKHDLNAHDENLLRKYLKTKSDLLELGIDPDQKDNEGKNVIDNLLKDSNTDAHIRDLLLSFKQYNSDKSLEFSNVYHIQDIGDFIRSHALIAIELYKETTIKPQEFENSEELVKKNLFEMLKVARENKEWRVARSIEEHGVGDEELGRELIRIISSDKSPFVIELEEVLDTNPVDLEKRQVIIEKAKNYSSSPSEIDSLIEEEVDEQEIKTQLIEKLDKDTSLEECVKDLLYKGARTNVLSERYEFVLNLAQSKGYKESREGHKKVFKLLLEHGSSLEGEDWLLFAALRQPLEVINLLLEFGVSPNACYDKPIIFDALECNNIEFIRVLIKKGADLHARSMDGKSVLEYAATFCESEDGLKLLMKEGVHEEFIEKYQFRDFLSGSELFWFDKVFNILLEEKKEFNINTLEFCMRLWPAKTVDLLLKDKLKTVALNDKTLQKVLEISFLELDSLNNRSAIIKLCDKKESILNNQVDSSGKTILHKAVIKDNCNAIHLLYELGANLESRDIYNNAPMHIAVRNSNIDSIRALLKIGVDLEARDKKGLTPLHHAAIRGDTEVINLLIEAGADLTALDNEGRNVVYRSVVNKNIKIVEFLLEKGANPFTRDSSGYAPVEMIHGNYEEKQKMNEVFKEYLSKQNNIKLNLKNNINNNKDATEREIKQEIIEKLLVNISGIKQKEKEELATNLQSFNAITGDLITYLKEDYNDTCLNNNHSESNNKKTSLEKLISNSIQSAMKEISKLRTAKRYAQIKKRSELTSCEPSQDWKSKVASKGSSRAQAQRG